MSAGSMRLWQVFKDAWQHRDQLGEHNRDKQLREFLPAALEVQQSPPSPVGRTVAWTLMAFSLIAIAWACIGQVNIVATAEGKIIPSGNIKQIQPLDKGVIKTLYVQEGQAVKKGDPLIELEQTLTAADQNSLAQEITATQLELTRLQTLQHWLEQNEQSGSPEWPQDALPHQISLYQQQLEQSWQQYQAERSALDHARQTRQAEWQQSRIVQDKLEQILPMVTKRAAALKTLLDKNVSSEVEWLMLEEQRIQLAQDLAAEKANAQKMQSAIREVEQQQNIQRAQAQARNLAAISETRRQLSTLSEQFNKAQDLNQKQILYAPVAGTVKQLAMNTIGGVVTEAQVLMEIVPEDEVLIVEAWLPNQDIGFVREGQEAEIKIHTFPFTKYGVIDAEVLNISTDAIADEKLGLIYKVKLKMAKNTLWVDGREVRLIPGMAVTAEVQTGQRRIIEYVSAPLLRYKQESVRER
jgi:hemolysin D